MANLVEITVRAEDDATGPFDGIRREFERLTRDLERDIVANIRADVDGLADVEHLRREIDQIERDVAVRVSVRMGTALRRLEALNDALDDLAYIYSGIDIEINVDINSIADVIELNELLDRIERRIRVRVDVDTDGGAAAGLTGLLGSLRLLPSLTGAAGPALLGLAANLAAAGAAAIAAAPAVIATVQEIASIGRAVGQAAPALAAFAVAGGVVMGTLKAIFAEGSRMRAVLQPIGDALTRAGAAASNAAARGVAPLVAQFNRLNMPNIQAGMVGIGQAVNAVTRGFFGWANSAAGVATINNIMDDISAAAQQLAPDITRVATSFMEMLGRIMGVSMAAGEAGLSGVLNRLADRFDSINAATVSAGFEKIRSTVSAVGNAFSVAIDWVQRAVGAYMRFREELGLVGTALSVVAIAFGGPITATVGAVSLIITNFDRLKAAYQAVVDYFNSSPWGASFMSNMRDAANVVIPAVTAAFDRFRAQVTPALTAVGQAITTQLIPAIGRFAAEAAPKVAAFIDALSNAVSMVLPHIIAMFEEMGARVIPVLQKIAEKVVNDLIPTLTGFVNAVAPIVAWFAETLGPVVARTFENILHVIENALDIIIGIFKAFTGLITGDWSTMWNGLVSILSGAWGIITALVDQLWVAIKTAFQVGFDIVVAIVTTAVELIIAPFRWLYEQLIGGSIIPDLVNGIITWFTSLAANAPAIISAMVSAIVALFQALLAQAVAIVADLVAQVINQFVEMMNGAVNAITSAVGAILSAVGAIKDAIVNFFASAGSWLVEAGKNIISGLVSGISSMAGAVADAVGGVVQGARNLLPFSPAKEGPLSGRGAPDIAGAKIVQMLAEGIRSQAATAHRAMSTAMAGVIPTMPAGGLGALAGFTAGALGAAGGSGGGVVVNFDVDITVTTGVGATPAAVGADVESAVDAAVDRALGRAAGLVRSGWGRR